jgi:hypothetical protein
MKNLSTAVMVGILSFALVISYVPQFASTTQAAVGNWQKGASIMSRWDTDWTSDSFKQSVQNLKKTGANYVALIIPYYQSNDYSTDIQPGANTPSNTTLGSAIDYVHSQGMKVMLKPHLEKYSGGWRANINPGDRTTWYNNYGAMLNNLADIGKAHGAEGITVGTELIKMSASDQNSGNTQAWVNMINAVRSRYSGILTYSANWGDSGFAEEVSKIGFWPNLDYIGISAYYTMWGDGSVQSNMNAWSSWDTNRIQPLYNQYHKPILFTEIGYRSMNGAHNHPWEWGANDGVNLTEQSNLYEAMFKFWDSKPYFAGVHLWYWSSDPNAGGSGDQDFVPQHKPAESVITSWFSQGGTGTTTPPTGTTTPPTGTTTPPVPNNPGTWGASATVSGSQVGNPVTLSANVTNSGSVGNAIVDLEIYNSSNSKINQQFFENQTITSSQPWQRQINWTPTTQGTYTLKIGVFNNNWTTNYFWGDNVLTFGVGTQTTPPPGTTTPPTGTTTPPTGTTTPPTNPPQSGPATTNIWWPTDGASVNGVQPFKAMLEGRDISQYKMYWQVDGDQLNEMSNSSQDYPHKESLVDLTSWTWKGQGPYILNFISKDTSGSTISQKAVNIYVR